MAKPSHVLDASGIMRSSLDYSLGGYVITPSVRAELAGWAEATAVEEAVRRGDIEVAEPDPGALGKVREAAGKTGDIASLSGADLDVLAVALHGGLAVITDDYAIQNTAAELGLKTVRATQDGIRRRLQWRWACGGCGRRMGGPGACDVCGHRARKAPAPRA